jgi:TetR/AcrR family transcriptional regulator, lmrAB and yxaGH operons repressor
MIQAAKVSFRANGMVATGFTEVLEKSGAARGAIYHHFPGGKEELAAAVVRSTGTNVEIAIRELFGKSASFVEALTVAVELVARAVDGDAEFGCAAAPAVLEAAGSAAILQAASAAFDGWQRAIGDSIRNSSDAGNRNHVSVVDADLAALIVASIEGALVLSRASGSGEPVRQVGRALVALLERQSPSRRSRRGAALR